jgi:hypothetical protein
VNARALNALAGVICRAQEQDRTPMGIAIAVESAGMLQSPESAVELERLREELAQARETGARAFQRAGENGALAIGLRLENERLLAERAVMNAALHDVQVEAKKLRERAAEHGVSPTAVGQKPQPVPVDADSAKAPWGRDEDGRPILGMGAHWTDIPELVDREVASIRARVDQAQPGNWYVGPATETWRAPGTVRTQYDGYNRTVGVFTNVRAADLDLVLHAHSDLGWCLGMVDKLRERVAELETAAEAELTVYRVSHEAIIDGLYTTAQAAREHCEAYVRDDQTLRGPVNWVLDEPGEDDSVEELHVDGKPTGYVVTPLTVASEFDAEADE